MNEIENNTPLTEDDEISLLDLIAVLIKHRFMIIFGTVFVFVFCCVKLFVLPALSKETKDRSVSIEYRIAVKQLPTALEQEISSQKTMGIVKIMAESQFLDIISVVEEIKELNPYASEGSEKLKGYEYNSFVKNLMKNKQYGAASAPVRNEIVLTMIVPEANIDKANAFVQELTAKNNKELEDYFFPTIDAFEKSRRNAYEELTNSSYENSSKSDIQTVLLILNQIDEFRSEYTAFLSCTADPFIIPEPLGRAKKTIVVTFAVFFILVFVAFLLNAIDNIKKDPEASEKIKTAWIGGKIGRKK